MVPHEIDHVLPSAALSVRVHDGYTIVAISGDIDIASVPMLREQLLYQRHQGTELLDREMIRKMFGLVFGAFLT